MSMTDPIADMLTRVRNGHAAGRKVVDIPLSKIKGELARILKREGYLADYTVESASRTLRVYLKYTEDGVPAISGMKRESKPGWRRYVAVREIPRVLSGLGISVLSTPAGIMTGQEAKKKNVGGELLCLVW